MFFSLLQKDLFKERCFCCCLLLLLKFEANFFQTKLLSRLSHKVCRLLCSPVLLRESTINQSRDRKRICRRCAEYVSKQAWTAKIYEVTHWNLQGWINFARHKHKTVRNQNRAKQLSLDGLVQHSSVLVSIGVVFMSCKVNFHVVRSALQISICLYLLWLSGLPTGHQTVLVWYWERTADAQNVCYIFVQRIIWFPELINVTCRTWLATNNLEHHCPTFMEKNVLILCNIEL